MPADLAPGEAAQLACLLEATARKPGNVHRFHDFDDSGYLDFALSALAIGPSLDRAARAGVGATVLDAVRATRRLVTGNTNLGMVLLLAPLAAAPAGLTPEAAVAAVLDATTIEDARLVYEAIRLARPGGLGTAPEQDVTAAPTVALRDAMKLAADRDSVALQYANGYAEVFGLALPALSRSLQREQPLETAIVATHLALLAELPDTLIARKRGRAEAEEAARRASAVLRAGWPELPAGRALVRDLDAWLRAEGHTRNPGATADLVSAALFAALRAGIIPLPLRPGAWPPAFPDQPPAP